MASWHINTLQSVFLLFLQPWFSIFAIPILGAVISAIIGKFSTEIRNYFSVATIGISALLASYLVFAGNWEEQVILLNPTVFNYNIHGFFNNSIMVDPLGAFVALIAAGLGFLIALFSLEYMKDDDAQGRYYFFLQLFVGGMVLFVLAGDLVILFFGWKIMGVCSYFLIAHWFHKPDPQGTLCAKSGIKAFLMTFVGDIALLIALGILWLELNTINIKIITVEFATNVSPDLQTLVALFILLGAISKSAQFPLITWLSSPRRINIDAMQGPTTVSALIHAATMVKAGVYLLSRFYNVFGPTEVEPFFITIAFIAAITAIISAASALVSIDIKRVLAYSTVSQIAYMFMGLAVGYLAYYENQAISIEGFMATQFHLLSHGLFKALLFLSAGAIIHSLHDERNIKHMGGLKNDLPVLHWSTLIGVCALAGVPFLFNGGYSKEAILGSAINYASSGARLASLGWIVYGAGIITAPLTAIYAFRFFFLIFYGEKPEKLKIYKPGPIMRGVTSSLAILVIATGFLGPILLNNYFEPMFEHVAYHNPLRYIPDLVHQPMAFFNMILAISLVAVGFTISYLIYYKGPRTIMPTVRKYWVLSAFYNIAEEGFYLDVLYNELLDLFMRFNWKLRKLQSGDLNYNTVGIVVVLLAILIVLLLF